MSSWQERAKATAQALMVAAGSAYNVATETSNRRRMTSPRTMAQRRRVRSRTKLNETYVSEVGAA